MCYIGREKRHEGEVDSLQRTPQKDAGILGPKKIENLKKLQVTVSCQTALLGVSLTKARPRKTGKPKGNSTEI